MSLSLFGNHKTTAKPSLKRRGATRRGVEAIDMRARRFGYFPRTFVWRGQEYQVEAVERCWTTASRRHGGQLDRHYFQVRCAEGTYNVYQDLRHNTWHIAA
ncbi:hypothetical protein TFLX_04817 [Thermoflexales bacterium]|jgi:hypothetical protein|nr:hypothetical protein TFLX_04817 [Thermoflexales bacterium]